jgi:hypothetical protein
MLIPITRVAPDSLDMFASMGIVTDIKLNTITYREMSEPLFVGWDEGYLFKN